MIEHGVVCWPTLVESMANQREDGAKQYRYDATYDFTFVNIDDPADTLTIRIQSHAMDNADKAPGKALSYAKKYAILKLFEIETGEDEESRYQEPVMHWTSLHEALLIKYQEAAKGGMYAVKEFHASIEKTPIKLEVWEAHGEAIKAAAQKVDKAAES
jgi:hypothetical protein